MRPIALADTGFLLALLDAEDAWHEDCVNVLRQISLPLLTSDAVLTELFYFLGAEARTQTQAWQFFRAHGTTLGAIADDDLPSIERLMLRYADRPMDFADATLVHLAERESLDTILTVDHDDFETYRIGGRKRFNIFPERRRKR